MSTRSGRQERGLELLRSETNRSLFRALQKGSLSEGELAGWLVLRDRKKLGRYLKKMVAAGAVERRRVRRVGRRVEYSLTESGETLARVIGAVEEWLGRNPERELEPVSPPGWRAFVFLVDAWIAGLLQRLAQRPCGVAELAAATGISATVLSGDLVALQGAGIVASAGSGAEASNLYALSEWGILGIGLLALSVHWQRAVEERPVGVDVDDALTALAAALSLVRLPSSEDGSCSLTVEPEEGPEGGRSGALRVEIRTGAVSVGRAAAGQSAPDAWVRGTVSEWLRAAVAGRPSGLRVGGRRSLPCDLLTALQATIYGE